MCHQEPRTAATPVAWAVLLTLAAVLAATPAAAADDEAKAVATKALDAGAAMFDARDAKGLAATYTDDAVLTVVTRDSSTKELKKEVKYGRAQIEEYYQTIVKPDSTFHAKNHVEFASFAGDDVLLVGGHFVPDTTNGLALNLKFLQARVKQGDSWKIMNMQVFLAPNE
ncbi:MAG: nuclear transport factor 2 family protein [Isosphaeraceae bacterium]